MIARVVAAVALAAWTAAAGDARADACLSISRDWKAAAFGTIAVTEVGRARIGAGEVALVRLAPAQYRDLQVRSRVVMRQLARPGMSETFYLAEGRYRAELQRASYAWPKQMTPVGVPGCDSVEIVVGLPGRWTPSPQVGVAVVGSRLSVAAEVLKVKWGLAAEAGAAMGEGVRDGWVARVEARRGVTRGYVGLGARVTKANARPHVSLSGALELPPLKRHPIWFVIELSLPRARFTERDDWTGDGLRRQRFDVSAGVRLDLVRVRR